ncbi:MAG: HAMP domain-containing histidine kinase [Nitrosopumilales archaeon]|nr:HAMP domain-containing histidine kinase [Nitrosopumilales archaeon]
MVTSEKAKIAMLKATNKELEEERKFKDEFITMMAHEMKNTLSTITSFSGMLLDERTGKVNESQKTRLLHIHDSAMRLNNLIRDVLDFQKIGLGQVRIEKNHYQLENLCKEATLAMSDTIDLKNITINAHVDSVTIYCDYNRILQVLDNLLNNAIKFSKPHDVITLNAKSDGKSVLFEVIDTGIGIKKKDQPKIFNKFEQLSSGINLQGGSGLGLAISKGLVELHGGKIWFESTFGKGTTFFFTIPNRLSFSSQSH